MTEQEAYALITDILPIYEKLDMSVSVATNELVFLVYLPGCSPARISVRADTAKEQVKDCLPYVGDVELSERARSFIERVEKTTESQKAYMESLNR
jgi:hypothetical protein